MSEKLYSKYTVTRNDGKSDAVDVNSRYPSQAPIYKRPHYFVLKLWPNTAGVENNKAEIDAITAYARAIEVTSPDFAEELRKLYKL